MKAKNMALDESETKVEKSYLGEVKKAPFPDMRIDCYGKGATLYLDGKQLEGITELKFERKGRKSPKLTLTIDVPGARIDEIPEYKYLTTGKPRGHE